MSKLPPRLSEKQMLTLHVLHRSDGYMGKEEFNDEMKPLYGDLDQLKDRQRLSSMLSRLYDRGLVQQESKHGFRYGGNRGRTTTQPKYLVLTDDGEEAAKEIRRRDQDGRYDLDLDRIREEAAGEEGGSGARPKVPGKMRMKLTADEYGVARIIVERVLDVDKELRTSEAKTLFRSGRERERVEKLLQKLEELPSRAKAGKKASMTREGVPTEDQKIFFPGLFEEDTVLREMKLKLNPETWQAFQSATCKAVWLQERGTPLTGEEADMETVEELWDRVCLLPKKSEGGSLAYLKGQGYEVDGETDDYRKEKYHKGAKLVYSNE